MPSKIISEGRGSGITEHTRRRIITREANDLLEFFANVKQHDPIQKAKGLALRTMAAIEAGNTDADDFEPFAGMGWYSEEILKRCTWLEKAIERGDDSKHLVALGFEIGALTSEAILKKHADPNYKAGSKHSATRSDVNDQNTKATHATREEIVNAILAERKRGVTDACKIASERFPAKGKASTFYASYYKKL